MLVLTKNDIEESVSILDVLEAVEQAFLLQESENFQMPDRMHVEQEGNVFLLMPAFAGNYFSTKLVSVFPENYKSNLPSIYASVLLNDRSSGKPLAMLEGSVLTGLRTGAVGGLAAAYTTPKDISSLGLVGTGFQAYYQALFICTVRNIDTLHLFDPFNDKIKAFIGQLKNYLPHVEIKVADSVDELLRESELIVTATTSDKTVLPNDAELLKAKHYIGLGSYKPDVREFPDAIFKLTKQVIIDTDHAKQESGDLRTPLENGFISETQIIRLGELINEEKEIDIAGTTFFKSVGMALFDLLTAEKVYERAIEKSLGTQIEF